MSEDNKVPVALYRNPDRSEVRLTFTESPLSGWGYDALFYLKVDYVKRISRLEIPTPGGELKIIRRGAHMVALQPESGVCHYATKKCKEIFSPLGRYIDITVEDTVGDMRVFLVWGRGWLLDALESETRESRRGPIVYMPF